MDHIDGVVFRVVGEDCVSLEDFDKYPDETIDRLKKLVDVLVKSGYDEEKLVLWVWTIAIDTLPENNNGHTDCTYATIKTTEKNYKKADINIRELWKDVWDGWSVTYDNKKMEEIMKIMDEWREVIKKK